MFIAMYVHRGVHLFMSDSLTPSYNTGTTRGQVYLVELKPPFQSLEFQFIPGEIQKERTGTWANIGIVGRNNSRHHLTGGEDKIELQLDFNSLFEADKARAYKSVTFLESLTLRDAKFGGYQNVKLVWGTSDIFRYKVWIVKSVRSTLGHFLSSVDLKRTTPVFDNHSGFDMGPTRAVVGVSLELDPVENERLATVRLGDYPIDPTLKAINDASLGGIRYDKL